MTNKICFILSLILFILPAVYAVEYGSEKYSCGFYGIGCTKEIEGGTTTSEQKIIIEPTEINVRLIVNTNQEYTIKITNYANVKRTISIKQQHLDNMIILGETSLELEPRETKELKVIFVALNETGIFTGKIIIENKEVLVTLNIRTKLLLFDSNIIVLNENYTVKQGDKLKTLISLIPKGEKERLDVTLNYVIKDYKDEIYLTKTETLLVEEQTDFERIFDIGTLPVGDYIVGLELIYPGGVAPSSAHFKVVEKKIEEKPKPKCCLSETCKLFGFTELLGICWYYWLFPIGAIISVVILATIIILSLIIHSIIKKRKKKLSKNKIKRKKTARKRGKKQRKQKSKKENL